MVGEEGWWWLTALQEPPGRHIETHGVGVDGIGNRGLSLSLSKQKDWTELGSGKATNDGRAGRWWSAGLGLAAATKWDKILDGKFRFPRFCGQATASARRTTNSACRGSRAGPQ